MKEERFFFDPLLALELPKDEAQHALRVLRLTVGDEIRLMDGRGAFHRAVITTATGHRCLYRIEESEAQEPAWRGHLHLAIAPTKNLDRMEWLVEKATEIGLDELTWLDCQFSERHIIKNERVEKIAISAMKQSHKAWLPTINAMTPFKRFVETPREGGRFICHCHEGEKPFLMQELAEGQDATVLIGPEGDFSPSEVALSAQCGYTPVSLGRSRLRTETAGLAAVHLMQITHQNP